MAIDTETIEAPEQDPEATVDGGLCRLDLPGTELLEDDELADDEVDGP
jgi:hypothetical protein